MKYAITIKDLSTEERVLALPNAPGNHFDTEQSCFSVLNAMKKSIQARERLEQKFGEGAASTLKVTQIETFDNGQSKFETF